MAIDAKKRRKRAAKHGGRATVGKITVTVESKDAEAVFNLIRQLALLSRVRSVKLSIKTPGHVHDIVMIYRNPHENGLLREKAVLKAIDPLVDYFNRDDVAIKGVIKTEGNRNEISELIKAFNTHSTTTVIK